MPGCEGTRFDDEDLATFESEAGYTKVVRE
jgi:hypothetical protein